MKGKDLLSMADLTVADIWEILHLALELKARGRDPILAGRSLALIFEKPSLRTRVSFEMAMHQLGGYSLYLSQNEVGLGTREPISDVARVLSRYVDGIVARTFSHRTVELLAENASIPVINGLSDAEHPCQALADLLTIYEKKQGLKGLTLAFIGDGNNVAHSLMLGASAVGMNFRIACPRGYGVGENLLALAQGYAQASGANILVTQDPFQAAARADVLYTDVWTSMGQEEEAAARRAAFAGYQVNDALLAMAKEDAIIMHDMPARRGEEIAAELIDAPQSVIFDQAENRLHAQKAILVKLLAQEGQ